ncbi:hypothetical protein AAMO2058_000683700 [Amorphochlora amoebiformis]
MGAAVNSNEGSDCVGITVQLRVLSFSHHFKDLDSSNGRQGSRTSRITQNPKDTIILISFKGNFFSFNPSPQSPHYIFRNTRSSHNSPHIGKADQRTGTNAMVTVTTIHTLIQVIAATVYWDDKKTERHGGSWYKKARLGLLHSGFIPILWAILPKAFGDAYIEYS